MEMKNKRIDLRDEKISFETAKLAKEKGFVNGTRSSYCHYLGSYVYDGDPDHNESYKKDDVRLDHDFYTANHEHDMSNEHYAIYEAPTQSLLQRWLREVHDIDFWYGQLSNPNRYHVEDIVKISNNTILGGVNFGSPTYEEALEEGLKEALKLI